MDVGPFGPLASLAKGRRIIDAPPDSSIRADTTYAKPIWDWFASVEVVEFGWSVWAGGASLMARPLASEARANRVSDVHEVDHRKKGL